jgi:hypothetical protein
MQTRSQLNAATVEALGEVQSYRGAALYAGFVKLLDTIDAQHLESLADAKVEDVPKLQGALSQVRALRKAMMGDINVSPIG